MEKSRINSVLKNLPHSPGIYKMKDKDGNIIYVGKAKDLSKRVRSYFRADPARSVRTQKLMENVADLEWTEVSSEIEALFLETNLIKEIRPKYNVLMKDDKNFVYIKITKNEDFPRVEIVRKVEKDGARYFGPKTAAHNVKKTLMLLQKLFLFRSCDLGLKQIGEGANGKVSVTRKTIAFPCLDYHIKRCMAPCISAVSREEYLAAISKVEQFFEGKTTEIEKDLQVQMAEAAGRKEFEKAASLRDKLLALKSLTDYGQVVTSPDHRDADIFALALSSGKAYINLFILRDGKLVSQENFVAEAAGFEAGMEESAGAVLEEFLELYYEKAAEHPKEILLSLEVASDELEGWLSLASGHKVKILTPQKGKKHKLVELAEKNAISFMKQHKAKWEIRAPGTEEESAELARVLGLPKPPKRIEGYDISHFSGEDTVASMVVFENGIPKKDHYRKFHLKTIARYEIDDFKSMEEILRRRLKYLGHGPKDFTFRKAAKTHKGGIEKLWKEWDDSGFHGKADEYFVALKAKKVVGMVRFLPGQNKTYLLRSFYVTPKCRGKGISRSLFLYGIEKLKARRIYLSCSEKMKEFYEGFGFESIKEMPKNFEISEGKFYAYDPAKHHDSSFEEKPDLILIDGGKGQLSSAQKAMSAFDLKIPMISLAKREEEVFVPHRERGASGHSSPIILPKGSPALHLLQRLRDEAHRFAVEFQRKVR
ncbi:MAG: excinuclease ABC subunit UvrC [Candidatus Gracilibacteria bacterium]|jgi:excinuclease ABC subunit C